VEGPEHITGGHLAFAGVAVAATIFILSKIDRIWKAIAEIREQYATKDECKDHRQECRNLMDALNKDKKK